jgi:hypothetical protein
MLLDVNLDAVNDLLKILQKAKEKGGELGRDCYSDIPI